MITTGYLLTDDHGDTIGLTLDDVRAVVTAVDSGAIQEYGDYVNELHLWRGRTGRIYACRDGQTVALNAEDIEAMRAILGGVLGGCRTRVIIPRDDDRSAVTKCASELARASYMDGVDDKTAGEMRRVAVLGGDAGDRMAAEISRLRSELAMVAKPRPVEIAPGITATPGVQGGAPCIAGTRWTTSTVREFDYDTARILDAYPHLDSDAIADAIAYERSLDANPLPVLPATCGECYACASDGDERHYCAADDAGPYVLPEDAPPTECPLRKGDA